MEAQAPSFVPHSPPREPDPGFRLKVWIAIIVAVALEVASWPLDALGSSWVFASSLCSVLAIGVLVWISVYLVNRTIASRSTSLILILAGVFLLAEMLLRFLDETGMISVNDFSSTATILVKLLQRSLELAGIALLFGGLLLVSVEVHSARTAVEERSRVLAREVALREETQRALWLVLEGVSNTTGTEFYRSLVKELAQFLGVRYAFISRCVDEHRVELNTLAFWSGDDFGENFTYDIKGTPCEGVLRGEICFYSEGIQGQFQDDSSLVDLEAEGYLGIPIYGMDDNLLGLLAVMSCEPMEYQERQVDILNLLARRAATEIEREESNESRQRFEAIVSSSFDAIIGADTEGNVLSWNPAAETLFGYSEEEMLGQPVSKIFDPNNPEENERVLEGFREGEAAHHAHVKRLTKDGRVIDVSLSVSAVRDSSGEIVGRAAVARDVTDSLAAEKAIRESEAKLRSLVKHVPDLIVNLAVDGTILFINRSVTGRSLDDLIGQIAYKHLGKKQAKRLKEAVDLVVSTGTSRSFDIAGADANGKKSFYSCRVGPVLDGTEVREIVVIATNLSEQKEAEAASREAESRYQLLADNMHDIIWTMDPDGKFTYISPSLEGLTGFKPSEMIGIDIRLGVTADSAPLVNELLEMANKGLDSPGVFEAEHRVKDGKTFWGEINAVPLRDEEGRLTAIQGVTRDITERKRAEDENRILEAQMQHAQKLESLGVLAGGIAHDFNNLLAGILGYASLLKEELPESSPLRKHLDEIEKTSLRAADLTRQMLAYSGKGQFVVEALNLSEAVEEMGDLLKAALSKKTELKYEFQEDLPYIKADATQIRQVIMNLITNASDASGEESGTITVKTGVMSADKEYFATTYLQDDLPEGEYVYCEVIDEGSGMDEEILAKIFDPFFTTKFTGRGLGLAAVLGIVRGHGGAIRIRSEVGEGTTFRVMFPRVHGVPEIVQRQTATVPISEPAWRGEGTILFVDDEFVMQQLAQDILERVGFSVLLASDGQEGVGVFEKHAHEITAVILDLTMPKMSGAEAFRAIRNIREDVHIILSSGYSEEEATDRFRDARLDGFLQKPYRADSLVQKIREVIQA